jgi:hypothetical protein
MFLCLIIKDYAMKDYGGVDVQIHMIQCSEIQHSQHLAERDFVFNVYDVRIRLLQFWSELIFKRKYLNEFSGSVMLATL